MRKGTGEGKRALVVTFCCNLDEYDAIQAAVKRTTCRSMSEYARKVLLCKPVTIKVRNISLDQLIDVVNEIGNRLEKLGLSPKARATFPPEGVNLLEEWTAHFHKIVEICTQNGM